MTNNNNGGNSDLQYLRSINTNQNNKNDLQQLKMVAQQQKDYRDIHAGNSNVRAVMDSQSSDIRIIQEQTRLVKFAEQKQNNSKKPNDAE